MITGPKLYCSFTFKSQNYGKKKMKNNKSGLTLLPQPLHVQAAGALEVQRGTLCWLKAGREVPVKPSLTQLPPHTGTYRHRHEQPDPATKQPGREHSRGRLRAPCQLLSPPKKIGGETSPRGLRGCLEDSLDAKP